MIYLLDTHVLAWWLRNHPALDQELRSKIDGSMREGHPTGVAAITLWELAMLAEYGRLRLFASIDLVLGRIESHPGIRVLPLTGRVAIESTRLGRTFPKDPADRLIAATARCHGLRLMTADERIRNSGAVALA